MDVKTWKDLERADKIVIGVFVVLFCLYGVGLGKSAADKPICKSSQTIQKSKKTVADVNNILNLKKYFIKTR